jgi:phenylpyruvate tautomerase PptA (4-oxalocrotonate tautomerase family)
MPLVDVEVIGSVAARESLATALADALGNAFGSPAGHTWVRLRCLPGGNYAENGVPAADTPAPVFVTVTTAAPPRGSALREEARRVAEAVAQVSGRPLERVHVEYAPAAAGRMAFGGTLMEADDD